MIASLTLLSPAGLLLALLAAVPVGAFLLAERRVRAVAQALRLGPPKPSSLRAVVVAVAVALLAVAAARPVLRTTETRTTRTDAQLFVVVDVSRSMRASASADSQTRLGRARAVALRLRDAVPEVPAGIAGLTDRVLPYVFPTGDAAVFRDVLARSLAAEAPPPREVLPVASWFDALGELQRTGFFAPSARRRLCVLITDGESRPFSASDVAVALLEPPACELVIVQVGNAGERIYDDAGRPEPQFRPLPTAGSNVASLAEAAGGSVFGEAAAADAAQALATAAGTGPTRKVGLEPSQTELAPLAAAGSLLLVLGVVLAPFAGVRLARWPLGGYDRKQEA